MNNIPPYLIQDGGSFRDPSAGVYLDDHGDAVRIINRSYSQEYRHLKESGLYDKLVEEGLLIPHVEIYKTDPALFIIRPEQIPFISYPYEWSFSQLKQAALTTLRINSIAFTYGMMLKDAPAYNIQWLKGRPVLIDTTSFMMREEGEPWGAYVEFLRHFLAPMLLIKYSDAREVRMLEYMLDGIPLSLVRKRLPKKTLLNFGLWAHVRSQSLDYVVSSKRKVKVKSSDTAVGWLLAHLEGFINSMEYKPKKKSVREYLWYPHSDSYTADALISKDTIVLNMLRECGDKVLDIGCNVGWYSQMASKMDKKVIAVDSNHDCIDHITKRTGKVFPLIVDLCCPSPAIGWGNMERRSFWYRIGKVDCILSLALIHHLCVGKNIPLRMVANLLAAHTDQLIIEWVPLSDPKADLLLGKKIIPAYNEEEFRRAFGAHFKIIREEKIKDSERILFLMYREYINSY